MAEELNYKEVPEKFADEKELGLISRVSPEQEPRQETGGQQGDPEARSTGLMLVSYSSQSIWFNLNLF